MARSTEDTYVYWIRRFILFHRKRHPLEMGKKEVEVFLTHLAVDQDVSASTQNQAFSALLFLYRKVLECDFGWLNNVVRVKRPKRVPVVFTHAEFNAKCIGWSANFFTEVVCGESKRYGFESRTWISIVFRSHSGTARGKRIA